MRTVVAGMLAVVMIAGPGALARQPDKGVTEVMDQYQAAWNKGDAKGLASLYAQNAIRIGADGMPVAGKPAIEQLFVKNFAGPWKGSKLTTKPNSAQQVTPEVQVVEGTFELTGGTIGAQRGRFLDTFVREGSQWRIAALASIPQASAPR